MAAKSYFVFGLTYVGQFNKRSVRFPGTTSYLHGVKDQETIVTGEEAENVVNGARGENAQKLAAKEAPEWAIKLIAEPLAEDGLPADFLAQLRKAQKNKAA